VQEVRTQVAATARPDLNQTTILSRTHVHRTGATAQRYKGSNLPGAFIPGPASLVHGGEYAAWRERFEHTLG
jgi:hypothetical protein